MKFIKVFVVLILLAGPVMAEKSRDVITIADFDTSLQGFSFKSGKLIKVDPEAEILPLKIDFIFDMPNGLGMNNSELDDWFPGEALVQDLGSIPIEEETDLIEDKFSAYLIPDEIIIGHTYLMKLAETNRYGKIHIVDIAPDNNLLAFKWVYLNK